MNLWQVLAPELILCIAASVLFLLGILRAPVFRSLAPMIALLALLFVFFGQLRGGVEQMQADATNVVRIYQFADYVKLVAAGIGALLVLLAWPTNASSTGNSALQFGSEASEFFALMLLSIAGVFLVAGANDIILLFLAIELVSIPTYIMVSVSRPLPAAQEAGVKYFFLGAMAAALMLFGFSYLYGATGTTSLTEMTRLFHNTLNVGAPSPTTRLVSWQMLAVVLLIFGFAFKLAAFPLHFYAGDVYQGAATPVTAFLSFVPKASGIVALIKILFVVGGGVWAIPAEITKLLWILAVLTMCVGNVLGLLQLNVKRVLAYSSIAHSGYMLVGVVTLCGAGGNFSVQHHALQGVMFYLAAYGIVNPAAFGVLMLLPARGARATAPATSAETFEDLAGAGRKHVVLGVAMAIACFSLIGIPLTVGFFGKFYLIRPALGGENYWLVVLMMINAATSAVYYLRIVGTMFLRAEPVAPPMAGSVPESPDLVRGPRVLPIRIGVAASVVGTILFGAVFPGTEVLTSRSEMAASIEQMPPGQAAPPTAAAIATPDNH